MKTYKIDILPDALRDIVNIRSDIIGKYNDIYNADMVVDRIFSEISSLNSLPKRAPVRLETAKRQLRFLKAGRYTVVYCVDDESASVKVYGVFHSRRDILEIIKGRG